ncbi:MAG: SDR family oxidoreductase [Planctomycetota bacterium]
MPSAAFATHAGTMSRARSAFLKDRVMLITGAERGIGTHIGRAACEVGGSVVLTGNSEEMLKLEAKKLKAEGFQALFAPMDVTNQDEVREVFTGVHERFGRLDVLVLNTGAGTFKPLVEHTLDDWYLQVQMNLTGTFLSMREALRLMSYRREGRIIVMNSMAARRPLPGPASVYCATRTALAELTDRVREEARAMGVHILQILVDARQMAQWDASLATSQPGTGDAAGANIELARQVIMTLRIRSGALMEEMVLSPPIA